MKKLSLVLAAAGLLLGFLLIGWFGAGQVLTAALSVGWPGFLLLILAQLGLFLVLGLAWDIVAASQGAYRSRTVNFVVFLWGRMVRDAAGSCLPFAQMGGFLLGARAVTLHGIAWPLAIASTLVDVTAEFLAQIGFAVIGLLIMLVRVPGHVPAWPIAAGLAVAACVGIVLVWLQQGAAPVFARLGKRIAGRWFPDAHSRVALLRDELGLLYGRGGVLTLGFLLHLLAWIGTGAAGWLAFRLLGADIDLPAALAIEALLHIALAAAFVVPGNIGIQEAAYIGLGAIFGLPPEICLGVSLVRRARDLAVGIPVLLVWQFVEVKRLRRA